MMENTRILTESLEAAANGLADQILQSATFTEVRLAGERLEKDTSAMALLSLLKLSQAGLRRKQARNEVTEADIAQVRQVQQQVIANESISAYVRAQQETVAYIRALNQELSELVGMDLASLLPSGCC